MSQPTKFQKVFEVVKKSVTDQCPYKMSVYEALKRFLSGVCKLSEWNEFVSQSHDLNGLVPILVVFVMKSVLDIEVLRELCLMPPEGCPLEKWHCFVGSCQSQDKKKCQNPMVLKHARVIFGKVDGLPDRFYEKYQELWEPLNLGLNPTRQLGQVSPLILFPVRELNEKVKNKILEERPQYANQIDEFYVCTDHFTPSLRTIYKYSLDYLNSELESDSIRFSFGRKSLKEAHALAKRNLSLTTFPMEGVAPLPDGEVERLDTTVIERQINYANQVLVDKMNNLQLYINGFGADDEEIRNL